MRVTLIEVIAGGIILGAAGTAVLNMASWTPVRPQKRIEVAEANLYDHLEKLSISYHSFACTSGDSDGNGRVRCEYLLDEKGVQKEVLECEIKIGFLAQKGCNSFALDQQLRKN